MTLQSHFNEKDKQTLKLTTYLGFFFPSDGKKLLR